VNLIKNKQTLFGEEDFNMNGIIKKFEDPDFGQKVAGIAIIAMIVYLVIAQ
jgi:hypothetical protein